MKKLVLKTGVYMVLILLVLEVLTRIFYLGEDKPSRFLDDKQVEKWVPNQAGYDITGNRNQNFVKYRINNSGFNSCREFVPSLEDIEIALVGDSFIEGFHQPYQNSIGKKIELAFRDSVKVFEYGYAGYDMADQLHLINAYKDEFKLIDKIYIKLKFSNDLQRDEYTIMTSRLNMESKLNKTLKKSKLLTYFAEIGILDSPRKLMGDALFKLKGGKRVINPPKSKKFQDSLYLNNFIRLVALYGYDKNKTTLLMDKSETSILFLDYLDQHGYDYIDFGNRLNNADKKTTLVYDKHWNDYGRKLISEIVVSDLRKTLKH